jgi:hypothetical protein
MRGHIRRRGQKSWEIKFDIGRDPVTGKRRIRYHSVKGTKSQAQAELARLLAKTHEAVMSIQAKRRSRNFSTAG